MINKTAKLALSRLMAVVCVLAISMSCFIANAKVALAEDFPSYVFVVTYSIKGNSSSDGSSYPILKSTQDVYLSSEKSIDFTADLLTSRYDELCASEGLEYDVDVLFKTMAPRTYPYSGASANGFDIWHVLTPDDRHLGFDVVRRDMSVTVECDDDAHGTANVVAPDSTTTEGSFQIEAEANDGYYFDSWTLVSGSATIEDEEEAVTTVTLPATVSNLSERNIVLKANFVALENHDIKVTTDGNGTANANVSSAYAGTAITLTATPNDGYEFDSWEVVAPEGLPIAEGGSFVMPDGDVEVKALFKKVSDGTPDPADDEDPKKDEDQKKGDDKEQVPPTSEKNADKTPKKDTPAPASNKALPKTSDPFNAMAALMTAASGAALFVAGARIKRH